MALLSNNGLIREVCLQYDNEFTSRLVLYPMGFGLVVNVWKLKRRLHLRLFWQYLLPWVGGKSDFSAEEKVTEDIDARGMKYIAVVLYPMVVCLAVRIMCVCMSVSMRCTRRYIR